MTGNETDAAAALAMYRNDDVSALFSINGSTRVVYFINGVLYKVQSEPDCLPNASEMAFIEANRDKLPAGVHFPDTSLYYIGDEPVTAAELIEGQLKAQCYCGDDEPHGADCLLDAEIALLDPFLTDSFGMNVIHNDKGYWLIDADPVMSL